MIGSIRFAGDFSPVIAIVVALLAALVVMAVYLRETKSLDAPYNVLLPSLRASAVALAILILAGPVWHRRFVEGTLGRVLIAVDQSASMSRTDSTASNDEANRMQRALRFLAGEGENEGWLESLANSHDVDVVSFSENQPTMVWSSRDEEQIPAAFSIAADGQRTNLSSPLSMMLAGLNPTAVQQDSQQDFQRAAVVIMTDGRDNDEGSPSEIAQQLKAAGVQVHAIGMGSEQEPPDLSVISVERPESVASDGRLSGAILLNQFGLADKSVLVRIESAGKTVWQTEIRTAGPGQQTVPFELDVDSVLQQTQFDTPRGVRRNSVVMDLRAAVDPVDGDSTAENNSLPFRVAAATRDRRLLILDGSSRWETRYIRNLFARDPAWQVDTVLFGPGTDTPQIERGEEPGTFPNTRQAMAAYDAVVIGEIPVEQLSEEDLLRLREFVTRGGGLVVIDGRYGRVRELAEQLPELIPVRYDAGTEVLPVKGLELTRIGRQHPVLNVGFDADQLDEFWNLVPQPAYCVPVTPQEGVEVWANLIDQSDVEHPWLVTRLYGAGRVFYFSTDQSWRWRYKVADRFHARFWNQLMVAVMQPPYAASDDYVALGTDKIEYDSGESATVRVRLQNTAGEPVGDATVDAMLVSDDRVIATVPLAVDDSARGTYQGRTPPLPPGSYQVRVRASGFDAAALQASTPIWVGKRDLAELNRVALDRDVLMQIAELGGGSYFHESEAGGILEELRPLSNGVVVESDILVWQSYYWFWAVLLLLAFEWWLRKRAGLV